jgi:predicted SnoaL-like aldol condensation-catalyzing enzyme
MKTIATMLALAAMACATPATTAERNKAVARRAFSEILEKGRYELADELYAPDFRNGRFTLAEDMAALRQIHQAMPADRTMRPELVIAEGDYVTVLWRAGGTVRGRPMSLRGITIWRIQDGKIREEWSEFDEQRMRQALGLEPTPAVPAGR